MWKILFVLFLYTLFEGCDHEIKKIKYVDNSFCVDGCINVKFYTFHSTKFLGSSSSMNGLSQNQIFDTVKNYCENFMLNKKCVSQDEYTNNNLFTSAISIGNDFYVIYKEE